MSVVPTMPPALKSWMFAELGQQVGPGEAVLAVLLDDGLGGLLEQQARREAPAREAVEVALPDVLDEVLRHRVGRALVERQERHRHVLAVHDVPRLDDGVVLVARERALPDDVRVGEPLQLRLLALGHDAGHRLQAQAVVRAVVLHRLDDRRVLALRRVRGDVPRAVGLDPGRLRALVEDLRRLDHRGRVAGEDEGTVQALVLLQQVLRVTVHRAVGLRRLVDGVALHRAA